MTTILFFVVIICVASSSIRHAEAYSEAPVTVDDWYSLPGDDRFPTVQAIEALRSSIQGEVFDSRDPESRPKPYWYE